MSDPVMVVHDNAISMVVNSTDSAAFSVIGIPGAPGISAVDSVNGEIGVIVITPDNLDDSETLHKFTNSSDKLRLENTSGTNTGDQDLSGLVPKTTTINGIELTSNISLSKSDLGLSSVVNADTTTTANISDSTNKRFITDTQQAVIGSTSGTNTGDQDLSGKVDKIIGKGLSTEDYTTTEKNKLAGIASGAEVNVNPDWTSISGKSQILNKPSLFSGTYSDLSGKPELFSGSYSDLSNKPTIPSYLADLLSDATHQVVTAQERLECKYSLSTGIVDPGGLITVNSSDNTKIDMPACTSLYVDNSDPLSPVIDTLSIPAQTVLPDSIDVSRKWIGIQRTDAGTGIYVFSTSFTALQRRTIAIRGRVWSNSGTTTVEGIGQYVTPAWGYEKTLEDLLDTLGSLNRSYNTFYTNADLTLGKTAGTSFRYTAGAADNLDSPNIINDTSQPVISAYHYHLGQETTGLTSLSSTIDPNYYDNLGTKTVVPDGKFHIQRIHYFPKSGVVDLVYGQKVYDTLQSAIDGLSTDSFIISDQNNNTLYGSILRAYLIVEKGTTNLQDPTKAEILEYKGGAGSGGAAGAAGAGSSAVDSVNGYTGVIILNPDDLVDTNTTHKFVTLADKTNLSNLSGTNTGDQDLSGLALKSYTINGQGLSGSITLTPDNLDDSLSTHKFVTSSDKTKLSNLSGTNTGDQDLSGLVPKTTTINGHSLNANISISASDVGLSSVVNADTTTTANISDSTNKRFSTDAEKTKISNLSGTNTGDQDLSGLVPKTITINSKQLNSNVTLNSDDLDDSTASHKFVTSSDKTKLSNLSGTNTGDQDLSGLVPKTITINGHNLSGNITVSASDINLGNVDNTSDVNKPISSATVTALSTKVDVISGKGLSTNDYTTAEQTKLAGIASGAEVNVNPDWNAVSGDSFINNKPALFSGAYSDLSGKPALFSGAYSDLSGKPTIPASLADLSSDSTHRSVTDTLMSTWSGKQDALGFTAESVSNKSTDSNLGTSDTLYSSQKAVKTYVDNHAGGVPRSQMISAMISFGGM